MRIRSLLFAVAAVILLPTVALAADPTISWGSSYPTVGQNKWIIGAGSYPLYSSVTCSWNTTTKTWSGHVAGLAAGQYNVRGAMVVQDQSFQSQTVFTSVETVTVPN